MSTMPSETANSCADPDDALATGSMLHEVDWIAGFKVLYFERGQIWIGYAAENPRVTATAARHREIRSAMRAALLMHFLGHDSEAHLECGA